MEKLKPVKIGARRQVAIPKSVMEKLKMEIGEFVLPEVKGEQLIFKKWR